MKLERAPEIHVRLGFFKIFFNDEDLPIFAIFYREEKLRGHFTQTTYNYKDYPTSTKYKFNSTFMVPDGGSKFLWLLKPTFLNRGRGIHVFSSLETLTKLI